MGHVCKDPRARNGTSLRYQTSSAHSTKAITGVPIGPNPTQESSSRTLANIAFDNSRTSSSFAPITQTPLVTMHSALNEVDIHTSTGTMDSALAAAAMEQRPSSGGEPAPPGLGSPTAATLALASVGAAAVEPSPRSGDFSTPRAELRKQGSLGAGSDKSASSQKRLSDSTKSPYDTPEGSPTSFNLDVGLRAVDAEGPGLPVFGQASAPQDGASGAPGPQADGGLDTLPDESELSTEFAGLAASMAAAGDAGGAVHAVGVDGAMASVGIDSIGSNGNAGGVMVRRGSVEAEKSADVSLSLQCPQLVGEAAVAAQGAEAERWSFEDLPKVHGDVDDSGTLEPDDCSHAPGSPRGQARSATLNDAPTESIALHSTSPDKSSNRKSGKEAESIVVPSTPTDAVKRDPHRRKKTLQFRMDGDLGLMSCVRVLFAASKDARGLISKDMVRVLLEHGVLKQRDMVTVMP